MCWGAMSRTSVAKVLSYRHFLRIALPLHNESATKGIFSYSLCAMASRPFLKRGQGTNLKYKISYPLLKNANNCKFVDSSNEKGQEEASKLNEDVIINQCSTPLNTKESKLFVIEEKDDQMQPTEEMWTLSNVDRVDNPENFLTPICGPKLVPKRRSLTIGPSRSGYDENYLSPAFYPSHSKSYREQSEDLNIEGIEAISSIRRPLQAIVPNGSRYQDEGVITNKDKVVRVIDELKGNQPIETSIQRLKIEPLHFHTNPGALLKAGDKQLITKKSMTTVEKKLTEQLREAIMNFDLAESELRTKYQRLFNELQEQKQELDEQKRIQKIEHFERLKNEREKIDLTKRVKDQRKGFSEKERTLSKQLEDAKITSMKHYSQLVDTRNKLKKAENELEKTRKEMEKKEKQIGRMNNRIKQLEKGLYVNPSISTSQETFIIDEEDKSPLKPIENEARTHRSKTDDFKENEEHHTGNLNEAKCDCTIEHVSDGDIAWKRVEVQVYHYGKAKATEVQFAEGLKIRLHASKQFDVLKKNGEVISVLPDRTRWERTLKNGGEFQLTKFSPDSDPMRHDESNDQAVRIYLNGIGIWYDDGCTRISTRTLAIQIAVSPVSKGKIQHLNGEQKILCLEW
ncbi:unnamed protein product, partial [Mesorhabditis belari]|uniref:Uncharacterized protein n=1 Tax=Mesorhabditis belari TaxID=2138241 RepID=A0AAF3EHB7_9BILA